MKKTKEKIVEVKLTVEADHSGGKWRICDKCGKDFEIHNSEIFQSAVRVIRGGYFAPGLGVTCPRCKSVNYY
jgi:hypothetical protein